MAYIKTNWQDQKVERPHTYEANANPDGSFTLVDAFGNVEQMGTPVNAQNMNKIENGIENSATIDLDNLSVSGQEQLGANKDLSNLSYKGSNIANWSNNISDCVIEKPQNIKMELQDGKLKIKEGSIFTYADGRTISTTKEYLMSMTVQANLKNLILVWDNSFPEPKAGVYIQGKNATSGDTPPAKQSNTKDYIWFDTLNRQMKISHDTQATWQEIPMPIGVVDIMSGKYTVIKHIFNGFGYIGGDVFTLPNVKMSIPIGHNEIDGSNKNEIYTIDKVYAQNPLSQAMTNRTIFVPVEDIIGTVKPIKANLPVRAHVTYYSYLNPDDASPAICLWKDHEENRLKVLWKNAGINEWTPFRGFTIAKASTDDNGNVITFKSKQVVRIPEDTEHLELSVEVINNRPYIIDTYVHGASGYILYSNKYCEQWGRTGSLAYGKSATISFLKDFANTDYIIAGSTNYSQTAGDKGSSWAITTRNVGSFVWRSGFQQSSGYIMWRANGYCK